ncbi:MAG: PKD domain-containing protein [Candidatus Bipolaricaulota bacterium]|nr:MAG: PKD domain-containing protein [Candidatus Bipolaricaulota bacterium]
MNAHRWGSLTLLALLAASFVAVADVAGAIDVIVRLAAGEGSGNASADGTPSVVGPVEGLPALEDTLDPIGSPPVIAVTASVAEGETGEVFRFDATGSTDADGEIVEYRWDLFSSGRFPLLTSTPVLLFPFPDDGTYEVRLRVTDDDGNAVSRDPVVITVTNRPPVPGFAVDSDEVPTGTTLRFDAASSYDPDGTIVTYRWDFDGDGTPETETNAATASHAYDDDGRFTVRLHTVDDDGAEAVSEAVAIRVINRAPTASFRWTPDAVSDVTEVTFSGSGSDRDGEVEHWKWTFGDGASATIATPTHRFDDDGIYVVSLVVTDDDGARSTAAIQEIVVANALPAAVLRVSSLTVGVGDEVVFTELSHDRSPFGSVIHMGLEFGDGTFVSGGASYGAQFTHAYGSPGIYEVALYAVDEDGGLDVTVTLITVE